MTIDRFIIPIFTIMKQNNLLLTLAFFFSPFFLSAQTPVNGKIIAPDSARVEVIRIFPDSFPQVSVIFKASSPSGKALWNLNDSNMAVQEDGKDSKIISLEKISKNKTINTALVIDHSGSMLDDEEIRTWMNSLPPSAFTLKTETVREYTKGETDSDELMSVRMAPPIPEGMHYPIWYAQRAAISYLNSVDLTKDKVSVVGFSDKVDKTQPLTNNQAVVSGSINSLSAKGGTAFYDAISTGISQVENADGINVVIAMTDGKDNLSKNSLSGVISKAKKANIPVYIIGLGDVDKKTLQRLANQTGGQAFFTDDPSKLSGIYLDISRQIQAVYELVYASENLALTDTTHDLVLQFEIGNEFYNSRGLEVNLPAEVLARLAAKENTASVATAPASDDSSGPVWAYAVGITVAAAGAGVLIARSVRNQKKKKTPFVITKLYPNPAIGPVNIETSPLSETSSYTVLVSDMNGQPVLSIPFVSGSTSFDTSSLATGTYIVQMQKGIELTPGVQLVVGH